ncbi:MAG: hypothetical protein ABJG88_08680, partial [Litorimonas sp.]
MTDYPFERVSEIYPAGAVLEVRAFGVIRHYGIATGYGTIIHASRRFGKVDETDMADFSQGAALRLIPYS